MRLYLEIYNKVSKRTFVCMLTKRYFKGANSINYNMLIYDILPYHIRFYNNEVINLLLVSKTPYIGIKI